MIVIAYIIEIQFNDNFLVLFGLNMLFFQNDFYFQLLSSMFLHGSFMHLFMNMAVLFQIGNIIEQNTSKLFLFLLFFIGGMLTSLLSIYFLKIMQLNHNMIGASGAISVLMGCIAYYIPDFRKAMLVLVVASSFLPFLVGISVAWYAHFIGFALGYLIAIIRVKN